MALSLRRSNVHVLCSGLLFFCLLRTSWTRRVQPPVNVISREPTSSGNNTSEFHTLEDESNRFVYPTLKENSIRGLASLLFAMNPLSLGRLTPHSAVAHHGTTKARRVARSGSPSSLSAPIEPFIEPTDWFNYGYLHLILSVPTLAVLIFSPPLQNAKSLQRQVAYGFLVFIVAIGVFQSFVWDSYGASMGFWEFNPHKCTLREDFQLPLEEVLWLFHHILKTALYQLKAFEIVEAQTERGVPSKELFASIAVALGVASSFGVWALAFSPEDSIKCIGLVCAFFAPVWAIIWYVGSQFVLRHANRITWGWLLPGFTTVLIDCLGQQQGVWRFPAQFLSGLDVGYLKLDIVLVYMVSTFAVTGTGAAWLAATEELLARRKAEGLQTDELGFWDVLRYLLSGNLAIGNEGDAFMYNSAVAGVDQSSPTQ